MGIDARNLGYISLAIMMLVLFTCFIWSTPPTYKEKSKTVKAKLISYSGWGIVFLCLFVSFYCCIIMVDTENITSVVVETEPFVIEEITENQISFYDGSLIKYTSIPKELEETSSDEPYLKRVKIKNTHDITGTVYFFWYTYDWVLYGQEDLLNSIKETINVLYQRG